MWFKFKDEDSNEFKDEDYDKSIEFNFGTFFPNLDVKWNYEDYKWDYTINNNNY